jgi:hypothetical protein
MTSESTTSLEVLAPSALEASERASIDIQIATAHRYPRSMEVFKATAISMATIDEETAESCLYRRPVGMKDGVQQFAEGMSVRMAEIVGASYGNLRVATQIIEQTPRFVRARGMAHDLQSNFAASSEVIESTVKKDGKPYDERMRIVIAKSALAKARRDATFQVVPRALAKPVEAEVRKVLLGDSQTLERRRATVCGWIAKVGLDEKRVWKALGIAGRSELNIDVLATLTGIRTAIKDNEVTIDEAFPPLEAPKAATKLSDLVDPVPGAAPAGTAAATAQPPGQPAQSSAPGVDREKVIDEIKNRILDERTSEAAILKQARDAGIVPAVFNGELFELLTADLVRIAALKGAK